MTIRACELNRIAEDRSGTFPFAHAKEVALKIYTEAGDISQYESAAHCAAAFADATFQWVQSHLDR
jgi:trans-aconitate methyltransferase